MKKVATEPSTAPKCTPQLHEHVVSTSRMEPLESLAGNNAARLNQGETLPPRGYARPLVLCFVSPPLRQCLEEMNCDD